MSDYKNQHSSAQKSQNVLFYGMLAIPALIAISVLSPMVEEIQDNIVFDGVITKTCFDRHGFNFITRWTCRSNLRQMGPIALGLGCAFRDKAKEVDICDNFEKIKTRSISKKEF